MNFQQTRAVLFDWGNTLMADNLLQPGPMAFWPEVRASLGAAQTLTDLRSRGLRLALATGALDSNAGEIRAALQRANLSEPLEKIYCFASTGLHKPLPEFYRHILDDMQIDPRQALMVGDNYDADVLAANFAGIPAAWYNPYNMAIRENDMHFTIHSLGELIPFFSVTH